MARGRRPLATAVKERNGSFIKDPQRRNKSEPIPAKDRPGMPDIVAENGLASAKWNHLCEILAELGLLAASDSDLMAIYSITWADWQTSQRSVWTDGIEVDGQKGPRTNPAVYEKNKAMDRLYKLGAEFGLNPSARTRLSGATGIDDPENPIDQFLNRPSRLQSNQ